MSADQLTVRHYVPEADRGLWDSFVLSARNATFLHLRDYMDYHADRFADASVMVESRGKLLAMMPGCRMPDATFSSHAGLTFGGLLMSRQITQAQVLEAFEAINAMLAGEGFRKVVYKPVPHIFHRSPAEEDLYALFARCGAVLQARGASAAIRSGSGMKCFKNRRQGVARAIKSGVTVAESESYAEFWEVLSGTLAERHGVAPVHSLREIELLHSRFPRNIRLFTASAGGRVVAGSVMYVGDIVAHTQYMATSPEGRECAALDLLIHRLITEEFAHVPYFDFGVSTEQGGMVLNHGLMHQKEGFGARTVAYDTYYYNL